MAIRSFYLCSSSPRSSCSPWWSRPDSFGNQQPLRNIAPTAVWVVWWVGLAVVSAFVGDLWALINPWRTLFRVGGGALPPLRGRALSLGLRHSEALGVWPAVVLLLFAWLELAFLGRRCPPTSPGWGSAIR